MSTARTHRFQAFVAIGLNLAIVAFVGAVIGSTIGVAIG